MVGAVDARAVCAGRPAVARAVGRCVVVSVDLIVRGRVHLRMEHRGWSIRFADGSMARVFRETVVDDPPSTDRCVLVVSFRLRGVSGCGHRLFEAESLLNTVLFVGFPGFVSKLWMAADGSDLYRGIYEWDDTRLAEGYARTLSRVLSRVSRPGSVDYHVLPGCGRDDLLRDDGCHVPVAVGPGSGHEWWRPVVLDRPMGDPARDC